MTGSFWNLLDSASRYRLLVSGHGKQHLLDTAGRIISSAGQGGDKGQLLDIGIDIMLTAWEDSPLDGQLAANLLNINSRMPFLPAVFKTAMEIITANYRVPQNIEYFQKLAEEKNTDKLVSYLESQIEKDGNNFFWIGHYLDISLFGGLHDKVKLLDNLSWPEVMKFVSNKYKGDFLFCNGNYEAAANVWSETKGKSIPGQTILRLAEALYKLGRKDEATLLWRERMNSRPWQVNTWLCAYDRIIESQNSKNKIEGSIALCIYTYNKAEDLQNLFQSLSVAEMDNMKVFALNNGCTDATSAVLAEWKSKFGDKLNIIELPVNIGAPAARNWLKHQPEISRFDFVAYLDDDAVLPENWQSIMASAIAMYPEAGVWGCKVADNGREEIIQHADIHLRESPEMSDDSLKGFQFSYFEAYNQDMDYGQYNYCRPCTSVTGCFHIFKKDILEYCSDFDLRYSPSQYDDLDHDLMLQLDGQQVVYQGGVKVLHKRRSGADVKVSREARGAAAGNIVKLESKYSTEEISSIIDKDLSVIETDFSEKSVKLASFLGAED